LRPQTFCTKVAANASRAAAAMSPWGLVNCKVNGPPGSLLTNRMSELLTYGSVGGGGSGPTSYPAVDPAMTLWLAIEDPWGRVADLERSAKRTSRQSARRLVSWI
jgi:hypothetical protein